MSNYSGYRPNSGTGGANGARTSRPYNKYSGGGRTAGAGYSGSAYGSSTNNYKNNYRGGGYSEYDNTYNKSQSTSDYSTNKPYFKNKFSTPAGRTQSSSPPYQDSFQIWMGDLDPSWGDQDIIDIWKSMGELPTAVKILKTDPYKPAYCFVSFGNHQSVSSAIQKNGMQIPGSAKIFKLNWASGGQAPGNTGGANNGTAGNNAYQRGGGGPGSSSNNYNDQLSVFVGDLPLDLNESVLYEAFNTKFPNQVKQVKIMLDMATKTSKGFGFIKFATLPVQQRAIKEMNGFIVKGRPIKVGPASRDAAAASSSSSSKTSAAERGLSSGSVDNDSKFQLPQVQPPLSQFTDPNNTGIYIKGLSGTLTEKDLRELFTSFGYIINCTISSNGQVGHIKYLQRAAAEAAMLALGGTEIAGNRLLINWDKINSKSTPTPLLYGELNTQKWKEAEEVTEPSPIKKVNEEYISKKYQKYDLLFDL
ncbi:hypothetical protein CLIB1423_25S00936 [[Candida] railenensis]|uniref:RRM domain-containing protein n=1 Tax=[Candida] railenensis TaxID=45579 RepID=A0A9P0W0U2_9ASCO|nr:hypothetical protein CLIB1423_25S00936 [[Candida] railenensis]